MAPLCPSWSLAPGMPPSREYPADAPGALIGCRCEQAPTAIEPITIRKFRRAPNAGLSESIPIAVPPR